MNRIFRILILLSVVAFASCDKQTDIDYRQEMRKFVIGISKNAKSQQSDFAIIVQNGVEITSTTEKPDGQIAAEYISAIDGQGQEDLFYGYAKDNKPTPAKVTDLLKPYLSSLKNEGKVILTTDYCSSQENIELSKHLNQSNGFVSFQATSRELDVIPTTPIQNENSNSIQNLQQVENFLYIINPENYVSKQQFINAVCATNYDLVIMDLFFDGLEFTSDEISRLRMKKNGGTRMVIAYMSIGEAEEYRYYWDKSWKRGNPSWLDKENPKWKGNYKVHYWNPEWQAIVFDYLTQIINAGFDGVYLDIIDAFEYYEG
ncbi:MAG: endo alpha-1,4 polygalactosaminidase [Bacteroidales bacterium]|nr:endo alpha-1,4 polygalactosaminidase [Bacteroidales bacterium]